MPPSKALENNPSLLLAAAGSTRHSSARWPCHSSPWLRLPVAFFCLCLSVSFPLLLRTPVTGLGAHPNAAWPHLNHICKDPTSKGDLIPRFRMDVNLRGTIASLVHKPSHLIFQVQLFELNDRRCPCMWSPKQDNLTKYISKTWEVCICFGKGFLKIQMATDIFGVSTTW